MYETPRWLNPLLIVSFCLVFLYALWCAFVGWGTSIVQQYEFVQAKAAIGAYYIAKGGHILRYELPVLGPPWSVPYEFPFYQTLSAWTHNLTGISLVSAGRLVSRFFYYLSLLPLFVIGRALGFRGKTILIPLTLFLASPIYLYWSRQFMNESAATFFGLAYLASVMYWSKKPGLNTLLLALILGMASATAKATTYSTFALASGLFLGYEIFRVQLTPKKRIAQSFLLIVVPLVIGLLWVRYTDYVKSQNPFAIDTHTSKALASWYASANPLERFSGPVWNHLFRITLPDAIGHRAAWIFSILLALALGKRAWLYWICSLLFLVAPMLFTKVHMLHDYYAHANCVFMVFGVAVLVDRAITANSKWLRIVGAIFFVVVIWYEVRDFLHRGYLQLQEVRTEQVSFAEKLKGIVPAEDVVLFYGEDWCPVIPFYSERRAIMMQNWQWYHPGITKSLANLKAEGKKVGALVLCHNAKNDPKLLSYINLGKPILKDLCDVYTFVEPHLR